LSWFVTRPETKGMSIYKSSDSPPPALGHFFIPDPPPSSTSCPPPLPPSSSPITAFRRATVLYPTGFYATAGLPESAIDRPADALAPAMPPVRRRRPLERGRLPPRPAPTSGVPPPHPPPLRRPPRPLGLRHCHAPRTLPLNRPARRRLCPRINIIASSCCLCLQPHGFPPQRGRARTHTPPTAGVHRPCTGFPQILIGSC
jgi:hypothetical protein